MENRFEIIDSTGFVRKSTLRHIKDRKGEEFSAQFVTFYPRLIRENGKLKDIKPIEDAKMVCNALNLYDALGKVKGKVTKAELQDLFKKHGL